MDELSKKSGGSACGRSSWRPGTRDLGGEATLESYHRLEEDRLVHGLWQPPPLSPALDVPPHQPLRALAPVV